MRFKECLLLTEVVGGLLFCASGVTGFVLEYKRGCTTGLIFWLPGMVAITFFRATLIIYDKGVGRSQKFRELMIGWAFVGNIVLAANYRCAETDTPVMYFTALVAVLVIDLMVLLYIVAACGETCCPVTTHTIYMQIRQETRHEEPVLNNTRNTGNAGHSGTLFPNTNSTEICEIRRVFWKTWLESYECFEHQYTSNLFVAKTRTLSIDAIHCQETTVVTNSVPSQEFVASSSSDTHIQQSVLTSVSASVTTTLIENQNQDQHADTNAIISNDATNTKRDDTPLNNDTYRPIPLDSDYDDDGLTCAICLLLLEEPPVREEEITGTVGVNAVEGDIESQINPPTQSIGINNTNNVSVIVKYPCRGSHYFHTSCLHHWLQTIATRGNRENHSTVVNYSRLTCPICREPPNHNHRERSASTATMTTQISQITQTVIDNAHTNDALLQSSQQQQSQQQSHSSSSVNVGMSTEISSGYIYFSDNANYV